MKRTTPLIVVFAIAGALAFNSCKKYDDGANLSIHTKKARAGGDWNIKSATQAGINLFNYSEADTAYGVDPGCLDQFLYTTEHTIAEWKWTLNKSGEFSVNAVFKTKTIDLGASSQNCTLVYGNYSTTVEAKGKWEFGDKKENIKFTYDSFTKDGVSQTGSLFSTGGIEEYEIVELRNKTMHLSGTIDQKEIDLVFEQ